MIAALLALLAPPSWSRLCGEPLDVSGTTSLPAWLVAIKDRDEISFPAHVALGNTLERFQCNPAATGLQWLKAASHASTASDLELVTRGITAAVARQTMTPDARPDLCELVRAYTAAHPAFAQTPAADTCPEPTPR